MRHRYWFWYAAVPVCCLVVSRTAHASTPETQPSVVVVVGAGGEEEFGKRFEEWARLWEQVAQKGGARFTRIGSATNQQPEAAPQTGGDSVPSADDSADRDRLKAVIEAEPKDGLAGLWLVLIGHGTFDGKNARFNLRGTDFAASELAEWLKPLTRPVAVINTSAASAPFVKELSAPGRVVVTATRSGNEQNFAYFGRYMAESIADPKADLDKDGQVSLLEAFLMAARRTAEFYDVEGRLATEHAVIDDNGDALGTPADFFRGIRAVKKAAQGNALDGLRAHQWHLVRSRTEAEMPAELRAKRDALELDIEKLRQEKQGLEENDYYAKLEKLLLELAKVYQAAETR
jgi:hypothetical protein